MGFGACLVCYVWGLGVWGFGGLGQRFEVRGGEIRPHLAPDAFIPEECAARSEDGRFNTSEGSGRGV